MRSPAVLVVAIALSGACGGDDNPAVYETKPGPSVPQPPEQRRQDAEGEVTVTPGGVAATPFSAAIIAKVEGTTTIYNGKQSGYTLEMKCGDEIADVAITLYFSPSPGGMEIIERKAGKWTVGPDHRSAEIVTSADDAGTDAGNDASDASDASIVEPSPEPELVDGVGLPASDGSRVISVRLLQSRVRYDSRATIPWLASNAPATCEVLKPGTGTGDSGCGSRSGRRSSGGDWD